MNIPEMKSIPPSTSQIRVKFLSKAQPPDHNYSFWLKRFPDGIPTWNRCDFIFDQSCADYDWLVVYDDLPRQSGSRKRFWEESLPCPRSQTLQITTEPSSIKLYGRGYLNQFGLVLTSQEPQFIPHPRAVFRQPGLVWFYGTTDMRGTYDYLSSAPMPNKTLTLSTVCSAKRMRHTLHNSRFKFTQELKQILPELDIFGHGIKPVDDKADALDPYKYHVAIENHFAPHHWTEKLADPLLAYCLPFYYGCPNVADYLPEDSFIRIDIDDLEESSERIHRAIRDNEWERRLPAICEARRLMLEKYSTFAQISELIEDHHPAAVSTGQDSILSRHLWRKRHPIEAVQLLMAKFITKLPGNLRRLGRPVFRYPKND